MNFKPISMEKAVEIVMTGEGHAYMLTEVEMETSVWQLGHAIQFVTDDEDRFPAEPDQWTEADEDPDEEDEEPDEDAEEIAEDPEEEDEPEDEPDENADKPAPKKNDRHDQICHMFLQGRTVKYIAQEFGINPNTVLYHLHKEGIK